MEPVDGFRRTVGTDKGACVDRVQVLVAKPKGQKFQLLFPGFTDGGIEAALESAGQVPRRLTVPDNIQGGHQGRTPPVNSDRDLIPFSSM